MCVCICVFGNWQSVSMDVDKAKNLVSECMEVADKLQSSPVCSDVARVSLHKQIRDLQTSADDVQYDWARKRAELETKLTHVESYYACYQVDYDVTYCRC